MAKKKKGKGKKKGKKVTVDSIPITEKQEIRFEPDEWYKAEFDEAEVRDDGQYGPYAIMQFKILNGNLENGNKAKGLRCSAMMGAVIAEGSEFWKFATAFAGREPKIGKTFKLSTYFGNKYKIFIEDHTPKRGKRAGQTMQRVKKIKKLKKKK